MNNPGSMKGDYYKQHSNKHLHLKVCLLHWTKSKYKELLHKETSVNEYALLIQYINP